MDILNSIWVDWGGRTALSFIFILSVVVFVHEMGHYLIARFNGVRVVVFSIGFGPELFGWNDRAGTRWKVGALPLGGYVKMFGDAGEASTPGKEVAEMTPEEREISFHHKSLGQRTAIVFGGPIANFALAVVIFSVLFATVGQRVTPPDISTVLPGSPAEAAGILPGDRVVRIDGREIGRFEEMRQIVSISAEVALNMVVLRDGKEVELVVTPRLVEAPDPLGNIQRYGQIGVSRAVVRIRHDPLSAVWAAVEETASLSVATLRALGQIIAGTRQADELGGPIRIAQWAGQVAEEGMVTVFWFMAVLSLSLGLINLFPIPMLDGGHLLFYAFEAVRGEPLSERTQEFGFRIGLGMILTLMVFVTWNDLDYLGVVDFVRGLFS